MVKDCNKVMAFDIDGVCLDWHQGFIKFAESKGFKLNEEHPHDTYDMGEWFHDMTHDAFKALVEEFNRSDECIDVPPLRNAELFLPMLKDRFSDYKFVALTAYGTCEFMKEKRLEQIKKNFPGVFDEIIIIGLGDCKKAHLAEMKPFMFVEDSVSHTDSAHELGVPLVFIVDQTYNKEDLSSKRVDDLGQVMYHVSQFLNKDRSKSNVKLHSVFPRK